MSDCGNDCGEELKAYREITPRSLSFGSTLVGQSSSPHNVTIKNKGWAPFVIENIVSSGDYLFTAPETPILVQPDQVITVSITCIPMSNGAKPGVLRIQFEDGDEFVNLIGAGDGAESLFGVEVGFTDALLEYEILPCIHFKYATTFPANFADNSGGLRGDSPGISTPLVLTVWSLDEFKTFTHADQIGTITVAFDGNITRSTVGGTEKTIEAGGALFLKGPAIASLATHFYELFVGTRSA